MTKKFTKSDFFQIQERVRDLDLRYELDRLDLKYEASDQEAKLICPLHNGHKPTLYVHIGNDARKGKWHCWHPTCGEGGFFIKLVQKIKDFSFREALHWLGVIQSETFVDKDAAILWEEMEKSLNRMNHFIEINQHNTELKHEKTLLTIDFPSTACVDENVFKYILGRGFDQPEYLITHHKLAITYSGIYSNRLLFPIYDRENRYRFFGGRSINNSLPPVLYPSFPVHHFLMGENEIEEMLTWEDETLYLVEGPFDFLKLWSLHIPVVSSLSAHLSDQQVYTLVKSKVKKVLVTFDGDKAGRAGTKRVLPKLSSFMETGYLYFPDGKDPGDIQSREEFEMIPEYGGNGWKLDI